MQNKFHSDSHLISRNKNGNIDTVIAGEKVTLETTVGNLVPRYTLDEQSRKKESPVKFYKTGELKSVPLEEATAVATPAGTIKSELVTFYKNNALWRIFPLDGQISGYWTEENEYELAETIAIPTSLGTISVKPIYLQFYETGELESILFWPNERVTIATSVGNVTIRKGICFHKNGSVKGFEPAGEINIKTPIGMVKVFDPDPNGILAESHSVNFYDNGEIESVITASSQVKVITDGDEYKHFSPKIVTSYCNENEFFISPLKIIFKNDSITFSNANEPVVTLSGAFDYEIADYVPEKPISCVGCE